MDKRRRVAVDLDGTLSKQAFFPNIWDITPTELWDLYEEVEPNLEMIKIINERYAAGDLIFIFTSRGNLWQRQTKKWLDKHKVKYHYIIMDKPYYDIFIDDKGYRPEEAVDKKIKW
jgi:uncharacterized HAD superfamily protein